MLKHFRNRHFFGVDALMICLAAYCSFVLRLDVVFVEYQSNVLRFTLLALCVTPTVFLLSGVYARYWRYASVEELQLLLMAVSVAALLITLAMVGSDGFSQRSTPRSIYIIFWLLAVAGTAGPRLLTRLSARRPVLLTADAPRRVLVMGAGHTGKLVVRELQQNPQQLVVVGFVDDDLAKQGVRIHGTPVLGQRSSLAHLIGIHHISRVLIAMPTAPGKVIREIVAMCETMGVETKTMPGISALLNDVVHVNQLRNVEIEDLLRREHIQTNITAVTALLRGKRVLITGGGGSIGSELCRQVLRAEPAALIVLGHGENSVFEIQQELQRLRARSDRELAPVRVVIADIRFAERMHTVFAQERPDVVFHAAAHKHVPLMELNPAEALTNNIIGTQNVIEAALAVGVEHFVMISTDKAVNPTSVMGATKRVGELLVHQAAQRSGRQYVAVRFGNVLGSRGSVVHTFRHQIAAGGPVTVTHPDMHRFFMTIPEAVQLVLQAAVIGGGGEVFVLDMGKPIKIMDLAHDMIRLSGLELGRDIEVAFTGLRPGEKLYEELFVAGEEYQRTLHDKIFIAKNASHFVPSQLKTAVQQLAQLAQTGDRAAIIAALQLLVPEFTPEFGPVGLVGGAAAAVADGAPQRLLGSREESRSRPALR